MVFAIRRAWLVSSGSPLLNLLTDPGITLLYVPILLNDASFNLYHPPGIGVGVGVGVRVGVGVFVGPAGVGVGVTVGVGVGGIPEQFAAFTTLFTLADQAD